MKPPGASVEGTTANTATPPAVSVCLRVLTKRADFLRASRGPRVAKPGFVLQGRNRADDTAQIRVGYTCSKKVGNAVARNRAKRRLREIARLILPQQGSPGWDYVLVGRAGTTATLPFPQLQSDLQAALTRLHGPRP
ncbi:MAG: ribonuclease P protein component [Pseudomonadota bacterium]